MEEKNSEKKERKMRDSGIPWIWEVPEGWKYAKAKYCIEIQNGSDPHLEGNIPVYGSGAKSFKTCGEYKNGPTVLIGRKGATLHIPHYIVGKFWNVDTAFNVYTKPHYLLKYYYYCAVSFDYKSYISQTTLPSITQTNYENMVLPMPGLLEQQQIVSFLDSKCSEIDTLIENLCARMESVKEYKKTVITEAVMKGLDKDVKMKYSGVEWIGEIPEGWTISRLGYECYIRARLGWKGLKADEYVDSGYAFISAFNIQNDKLVWSPLNYITRERYDESPEIKINIGDVLIVKDGAGAGKCARVDELPFGETAPNSSIGVLTPYINLEYKYLSYYMLSNIFNNMVLKLLNGMGVPHLTQEILKKANIILPPLEEQHRIADYLDSKCSEIDALLQNYDEQITVLEEYKKSLIYEYVTGKKILTSNHI